MSTLTWQDIEIDIQEILRSHEKQILHVGVFGSALTKPLNRVGDVDHAQRLPSRTTNSYR